MNPIANNGDSAMASFMCAPLAALDRLFCFLGCAALMWNNPRHSNGRARRERPLGPKVPSMDLPLLLSHRPRMRIRNGVGLNWGSPLVGRGVKAAAAGNPARREK